MILLLILGCSMDLATGEENIAPAKRGKRAQFLFCKQFVNHLMTEFFNYGTYIIFVNNALYLFIFCRLFDSLTKFKIFSFFTLIDYLCLGFKYFSLT